MHGRLESEFNVSVIIPTMACIEREFELKRAVQSIRLSSSNPIRIIVVVNGNRADSNVLDWLSLQADIQLEIIPTPSLPNALFRGRELVRTEYFSVLDDDDTYLPGATDKKLEVLAANKNADYLVGNSFKHLDGIDMQMYTRLTEVPHNPLRCLMEFAWLHNGNALYRTESIALEYFKDIHAYAEWTWLAFRLTLAGKRVVILDEPVFRYIDTAGSLSKSRAYFHAHIPLFKRMLSCLTPSDIRKMILKKESAAYHDASNLALREGNRIEAIKYHWKSLCGTGGLRYLTYTRHILK